MGEAGLGMVCRVAHPVGRCQTPLRRQMLFDQMITYPSDTSSSGAYLKHRMATEIAAMLAEAISESSERRECSTVPWCREFQHFESIPPGVLVAHTQMRPKPIVRLHEVGHVQDCLIESAVGCPIKQNLPRLLSPFSSARFTDNTPHSIRRYIDNDHDEKFSQTCNRRCDEYDAHRDLCKDLARRRFPDLDTRPNQSRHRCPALGHCPSPSR